MSTMSVNAISSYSTGYIDINNIVRTSAILPQGEAMDMTIANVQIGLNSTNLVVGNTYNLSSLNSSNGQTTVVGSFAGLQLTSSATQNTLIGSGAGLNITTGIGNTFVGANAGRYSTGNQNTFVGGNSGLNNTTGLGNTCLGEGAGSNIETGSSNTFIGVGAGNVGGGTFNGQNNIAIGIGSVPSSNDANGEITLGSSGNNVLRCAATTITSLSDARDKKDIKDLSAGLSFVKTLKPVEFVWNDRDENGKRDIKDFGFIAQDLKASQEEIGLAETLKLVYESNPEKLEASYGKLVPILVKAIQELTAKVEELEKNK